MVIFTVLGWIVGILMILGGGFGVYFSSMYTRVSRWEADQMREHGQLEGEPEFMKTFRAAESEGDAIQGGKWMNVFTVILLAGVCLTLFMFFN